MEPAKLWVLWLTLRTQEGHTTAQGCAGTLLKLADKVQISFHLDQPGWCVCLPASLAYLPKVVQKKAEGR